MSFEAAILPQIHIPDPDNSFVPVEVIVQQSGQKGWPVAYMRD